MALPRFLKTFSAGPKARALAREESGATIIEFAILAVPFFALIAAILETAFVMLASQVLDSAVNDSTRLIRTGQAQSAGFTINEYRDAVCEGTFGLFDCSKLKIKVQKITSFTNVDDYAESPVDEDGEWTITESYAAGQRFDIIYTQVYYKWPTIFDFLSFNLADQPDGTRLLGAARVFKNEPF